MGTRDKKPRRDKRRCVHYYDWNNCGGLEAGFGWSCRCDGVHGCASYEERKRKGEKNGWR